MPKKLGSLLAAILLAVTLGGCAGSSSASSIAAHLTGEDAEATDKLFTLDKTLTLADFSVDVDKTWDVTEIGDEGAMWSIDEGASVPISAFIGINSDPDAEIADASSLEAVMTARLADYDFHSIASWTDGSVEYLYGSQDPGNGYWSTEVGLWAFDKDSNMLLIATMEFPADSSLTEKEQYAVFDTIMRTLKFPESD